MRLRLTLGITSRRVLSDGFPEASYTTTANDEVVTVTVPYTSGMASDFRDVRLKLANGTQLDQYRLSYTSGVTSTWKVRIPTAGSGSLYAEYGVATSILSDGAAVYPNLFDDGRLPRAGGERFLIMTSFEGGTSGLAAAIDHAQQTAPDAVIILGDTTAGFDGAGGGSKAADEAAWAAINAELARLGDIPVYFGLGNHDIDYLTKAEWLAFTGMSDTYFSVVIGDTRLIFLDPWFNSDNDNDDFQPGSSNHEVAYVPPKVRTFLSNELSAANTAGQKVHVFNEKPLVAMTGDPASYQPLNAADVRTILAPYSTIIKRVWSGHSGEAKSATADSITHQSITGMDVGVANGSHAFVENVVEAGGTTRAQGYGHDSTANRFSTTGAWDTNIWTAISTPVVTFDNGRITVDDDTASSWDGLSKSLGVATGVMRVEVTGCETNAGVALLDDLLSGSGRDGPAVIGSASGNEIRGYVSNSDTEGANADFPAFPFEIRLSLTGSQALIHYDSTLKHSFNVVPGNLIAQVATFNVGAVTFTKATFEPYVASPVSVTVA